MTEQELKRQHPSLRKVLDFIKSEISGGHAFPSVDAIGYHMGYRTNRQAHDALTILTGYGFLDRSHAAKWPKRYVYDLKRDDAA